MSRILVTGGAGFIGSNLVSRLVEAGDAVRVVDNLSTGYWENLEAVKERDGVELVEADIRDGEAMAAAAQGVEVVYHLAALGSVPRSFADPVTTDAVNTHGTVTVLDAARHAGVRRVVFAGSSSVYGDSPTLPKREDMPTAPLSPYAVSKLAGEHYLKVFAANYDIETVTLRYFNVFGPRQRPEGAYAAAIPRFGWAAVRGEPITVYGDGEQSRDFSFIDNTVSATILAGTSSKKLSGQVVNVATGRRVTVNDVITEIGKLTGRSLDVRHDPPRAGDVRHSLADISRASDLLGFEPSVFWQEGVRQTLPFLERLDRETRSP